MTNMKKIFLIIAVIAIFLPFWGCDQEMISYEGKRGVYFSVRWGNLSFPGSWPYYSYSYFNFAKVTEATSTATVKVMITDTYTDYPRPFRYSVDLEKSTAIPGVHYDAPSGEGIIPAGDVVGYATVVVHRTLDMENEEFSVVLQLEPNEYFDLAFTTFIQIKEYNQPLQGYPREDTLDASRHTLILMDVMTKPDGWYGGFYQYGAFEEFNLFGAFTSKKCRLITELYGLTYEQMLDSTIFTYGYQGVLSKRFSAYLIEQYRNRTPILENDGRLMWAGDCPWKSYENVPWDGVFNPEY